MNTIKLNAEQILDIIFEKKVVIGELEINSEQTYLGILAKLDERLRHGKAIKRENTVLCGLVDGEHTGNRNVNDVGSKFRRRKKFDDEKSNLYGSVGKV